MKKKLHHRNTKDYETTRSNNTPIKINKLEEMDDFLQSATFQVQQEETKNKNRLITNTDIETGNKKYH